MAWKITEVPDEESGGPGGCVKAIGIIIFIIIVIAIVANS